MRTILFSTLFFVSVAAFSQSVENENFWLHYDGRNFTLLNKVQCEQTIMVRRPGKDTTIILSAGEAKTFTLPGANGQVQAKTIKSCNAGANGVGWLSLSLSTLPIREPVKYVRNKEVAPGMVRIVAINGGYATELTEAEFQKTKDRYRRHFYILRPNKPKEIII